jgi:ABC-type Fe3+ transport system permease subunit
VARRDSPQRGQQSAAALLLAVTVSVCLITIVGAAAYAIVLNSLDWHQNHAKGTANLGSLLAALIGSLLSAAIAGVVGFISGKRVNPRPTEPPPPTQPPPFEPKGQPPWRP